MPSPSIVQFAEAEHAQVVAFGSNVHVGNLIVVIFVAQTVSGGPPPPPTAPTDNSGINTYVACPGASCNGGLTSMATFYCTNKASGSWTVSESGPWTGAYTGIYVFEVSGATAYDNGGGAFGTTTGNASTGNFATNHPNEIVVAATINQNTATNSGPGYTLLEITGDFADCLEYALVGAGTQDAQAVMDGSSQQWGIVAAAFYTPASASVVAIGANF